MSFDLKSESRWGSADGMVEEDDSLWPTTMNRLHEILCEAADGRLLSFEVEHEIDSLYRSVFDGLTSMGCGFFWGFVKATRGH